MWQTYNDKVIFRTVGMDAGATGAVASGNTGKEATTDWETNNPDPQGWSRIKQGPPATASKSEWGTLDDGGWEFFTSPKLAVFRSKAKDNAKWYHQVKSP